jgi:hypothetical protein
MPDATFVPGDIIIVGGETYQVLEDHGDRGTLLPFPVVDGVESEELEWSREPDCRRIGHAPLPAPSPCATSGSCPTEGRLDLPAAAAPNPNLIAKA